MIFLFQMNYVFQKGGPKYSCSYPASEDVKNNIFVIKGRNDKGKSTILQMVALGLYGLESKDIDKTLKDKMQRLISPETTCNFDFKIISNDEKTAIDVSMKETKTVVKINNAIKNPTHIEENLKILFDVPDDPTKKLASALRSIEHNLRQYDQYVRGYMSDIGKELESVERWASKSSRLIEEQQNLEDLKKTAEQIKGRLDRVKERFEWLENCRILSAYNRLADEYEKLKDENKKIDERIKELKSSGLGGGNVKYKRLIEQFRDILISFRSSVRASKEVTRFLENGEKAALSAIIKEIESVITVKDLNNKKLKNWEKYYDELLKKLESNPINKRKLVEEDQIKLVERLIPILRDFVGVTAIVPGTNGKDIGEFIKELEVSRNELTSKISEKIELTRSINKCTDILKLLGDVAIAYTEVPKIDESDSDDLDNYVNHKDRNDKRMDNIVKELTRLEDKVESIPERQRILIASVGYDEKEYDEFKNEKTSLETKWDGLKTNIASKNELLKELEKTPKPLTRFRVDDLKALHRIVDAIPRKLNMWMEYVSSLNLIDLNVKNTQDIEARRFYDALGMYFADVLTVIYFENKPWKVKKVDLLNRQYVVDNRAPIDFVDFGTGHNQLNSCMARLKQNYGGRKKIVLFDELTVMDKNNINILLKEIEDQVKNGSVILALLTQADNNLDDVIMEPVKLE